MSSQVDAGLQQELDKVKRVVRDRLTLKLNRRELEESSRHEQAEVCDECSFYSVQALWLRMKSDPLCLRCKLL